MQRPIARARLPGRNSVVTKDCASGPRRVKSFDILYVPGSPNASNEAAHMPVARAAYNYNRKQDLSMSIVSSIPENTYLNEDYGRIVELQEWKTQRRPKSL